ncbi:hypothetical protein PI124_g8522 [Phytophthora idaei]|nr:hypothetical protein PI125_g17802 [Phytophthora idaei]KAG3139232.1 hypothetical protein PI126_g16541 [Phytophthora idaei]KAG3246786.1 hypothetical protein PI124_g8522 [Phytophthora idaei]
MKELFVAIPFTGTIVGLFVEEFETFEKLKELINHQIPFPFQP